jgi:hypothetical protein
MNKIMNKEEPSKRIEPSHNNFKKQNYRENIIHPTTKNVISGQSKNYQSKIALRNDWKRVCSRPCSKDKSKYKTSGLDKPMSIMTSIPQKDFTSLEYDNKNVISDL